MGVTVGPLPQAHGPAERWHISTSIDEEGGYIEAQAVGYIPLTPNQCFEALTAPGENGCQSRYLDGCHAAAFHYPAA